MRNYTKKLCQAQESTQLRLITAVQDICWSQGCILLNCIFNTLTDKDSYLVRKSNSYIAILSLWYCTAAAFFDAGLISEHESQ